MNRGRILSLIALSLLVLNVLRWTRFISWGGEGTGGRAGDLRVLSLPSYLTNAETSAVPVRDLFALGSGSSPKARKSAGRGTWILTGIVFRKDQGRAFLIKDGRLYEAGEGEDLAEGWKITKVGTSTVYLSNPAGGTLELPLSEEEH